MSTSPASPPPSPLRYFSHSPERAMSIRIPGVSSLLVKIRRTQGKSKAHHIESSSGDARTHPSLQGEGVVSVRKVPLVEEYRYVCRDGVDVSRLLRAIRGVLYERALALNATVLVDEEWSCTICGPRHRSDGTFRVSIRYAASAARSTIPDPQQPISLEKAKGVPGLMTVVARLE